ncbi:endonuclease/exonuclease/phosphatase family protein [Alteromonas sp. SM 2104]|nr:endonuclease/exonuclease/phosphatase family protein [Alteromonas oceanisediminis]
MLFYLGDIAYGLSYALTLTVCAITLLPLVPNNHWVFRVWEFPRVQIIVLAIFGFVLLVVFASEFTQSEWIAQLIAVFAVACFQSYWILPYTQLYKSEVARHHAVAGDETLTILTANVLMTNRNAQGLIRHVKVNRPDILVTLESNQWWQDQLDPVLTDYPHRVSIPLDNLYGMHVYSRLALHDVVVSERVKEGIPSVKCGVSLPSGAHVKCFFVHPEPPSPTEAPTAAPRDCELMRVADEAIDITQPVIVTGDLNDVAWSPTTREFQRRSGLFDPRVGRGFFNTFHAQHGWARWPLDHIFVSREFALVSLQRLDEFGSDHFPLLTTLKLNP